MRIKIKHAILFGLLATASSLSLAHHSFSMFDQTKKVTIAGKVTDVQWTNPHVWIFLEVPKDGGMEKWGVEFTSKVHLARRNFDPEMLKVGDNVEFTVSPYANGKPGGRFYTVKLANGKYYCDNGAQEICAKNNGN